MCSLAAGISGGLNLFQGLAMRGAAKDKAGQVAEQERQGVQSAEDNKRQKRQVHDLFMYTFFCI